MHALYFQKIFDIFKPIEGSISKLYDWITDDDHDGDNPTFSPIHSDSDFLNSCQN